MRLSVIARHFGASYLDICMVSLQSQNINIRCLFVSYCQSGYCAAARAC